jgi:KaiC/GvpD/RAD55 family RecA-like ATPase
MSRKRVVLSDVVESWRQQGPLVHFASCFPTLDDLTGGGPVFGTRWYLLGAPDASKTLLLSLWADVWSRCGITVGMLAVDEEPEDLAQRFIQRLPMSPKDTARFQRIHCEARDPRVLDLMSRAVEGSTVVFYDSQWTVESAAGDLLEYSASNGKKPIGSAMLFDSVQTIECDALRKMTREIDLRTRITANVQAIRNVATKYKMITVSSSEMNRAAYRAIGTIEQDDMAAAKESGAIEYSARVMISLRPVKDEDDMIEMRVVKNKHGRRYPSAEAIYLQLDRATQHLQECAGPEKGDPLDRELAELVASRPVGATTDWLRAQVRRKRADVIAAMLRLEALGLVKRHEGDKSPWVACIVPDADSDEFP